MLIIFGLIIGVIGIAALEESLFAGAAMIVLGWHLLRRGASELSPGNRALRREIRAQEEAIAALRGRQAGEGFFGGMNGFDRARSDLLDYEIRQRQDRLRQLRNQLH